MFFLNIDLLVFNYIFLFYYLLAYIISDEESYYDPGRIDIKSANGVQWLNFFIDAKGFHIKDIVNPGEYVSDVLDLDLDLDFDP